MDAKLLALSLLLTLLACTEPITVGSDLLEGDRATVGQTVDLPFTARVIAPDSVFTINGPTASQAAPFTLGAFSDPNFGSLRHAVYLIPKLPENSAAPGSTPNTRIPNFASNPRVRIDSASILVPIDSATGFYGSGRDFPLAVFPILDRIIDMVPFFSNLDVPVGMTSLAAVSSLRPLTVPTLVRDTSVFDSVAVPHLNIPLSDAFVQQLNDLPASAYTDQEGFRDRFPGVFVVPTAESGSLVTLVPDNEQQTGVRISGFNLYYREETGDPAFYRIRFDLALPQYRYDFAGSQVQSLLDDGADDELIAVAGQGGLITEISFDSLDAYRDRVINQAELLLALADVPGLDYTEFDSPQRIEMWYRATADGPLLRIADRLSLNRGRASSLVQNAFLGGERQDDGSYSAAFTIHMQRILDETVPPRLYVRVTPLALQAGRYPPNRAYFTGPRAADRPARIRLTFTDLDE